MVSALGLLLLAAGLLFLWAAVTGRSATGEFLSAIGVQ